MPFRTFVCSNCKSAHQAYSHRVKVRAAKRVAGRRTTAKPAATANQLHLRTSCTALSTLPHPHSPSCAERDAEQLDEGRGRLPEDQERWRQRRGPPHLACPPPTRLAREAQARRPPRQVQAVCRCGVREQAVVLVRFGVWPGTRTACHGCCCGRGRRRQRPGAASCRASTCACTRASACSSGFQFCGGERPVGPACSCGSSRGPCASLRSCACSCTCTSCSA